MMPSQRRPRVSIIIPCYNGQAFVGQAIESVLAQTMDEYEIVVIDDGSTDNSAEVIRGYASVRYRYQSNRGPAAARNAGLSMAMGEMVAFLDADDLWHPEMLAACVSVLDDDPKIGAVHTSWQAVDERGQPVSDPHTAQGWRGDIFERLLVTIPFNGSAILWRKVWYDAIGGIDETPELNDDWLNWLRIARAGCQFECVDRLLAFRREHTGQLTAQQTRRILQWRLNTLHVVGLEMEIPASLMQRAYEEPYLLYAAALLKQRSIDSAMAFLSEGVQQAPGLLDRIESHYALAEAAGLYSRADDAQPAAAYLRQVACAMPGRGAEGRRWRYLWQLCLARRAYAVGASWPARWHLVKSAWCSPLRMMVGANLGWVARILVGSRVAHSLRARRAQN